MLVNFETDQGRSVLMELTRDDGGFIPLGADVQTEQGVSVGSVGQAGQARIRGIEDKGLLKSSGEVSPAHPVLSPIRFRPMRKRLDQQRC